MKRSDSELLRAYTNVSVTYDQAHVIPFFDDFVSSAIVKMLGVREGMRVLEVAAGTGRTAIPLAETGAMVTAIDLTPSMLVQMQSKARELGLRSLHIHRANARCLPFSDNTFDAAISLRFFHLFCVQDQCALLREMHRVVKSDGVVLVEHNNGNSFWAGRIVQDLLRRLKGQNPVSRISRSQLRDLYQDYEIVHRQGLSWHGLGRIARLSPMAAKLLLELSMRNELAKYTRFTWVVSAERSRVSDGNQVASGH